jgi:hypothetical protein
VSKNHQLDEPVNTFPGLNQATADKKVPIRVAALLINSTDRGATLIFGRHGVLERDERGRKFVPESKLQEFLASENLEKARTDLGKVQPEDMDAT